jgi:hypothetical protein
MRTIINLAMACFLSLSAATGLTMAAGQFQSDFVAVARTAPAPEHPSCDGDCPNPAFVVSAL